MLLVSMASAGHAPDRFRRTNSCISRKPRIRRGSNFDEDPTYLLHALEDTKRQIPEAALEICEVFVNRCAEKARDIQTSLAADERTVGKIVF